MPTTTSATVDNVVKYHVLFCPISVCNLPKLMLNATGLTVTFLGEVSSLQGLKIDSKSSTATWKEQVMRKTDVSLQFLMGDLLPHKERITLSDSDNKKSSVSCEVDLASVCKQMEPFQIVMPLELCNKEKTVLTVKVLTMPDLKFEEYDERVATDTSFMLEGLSSVMSAGDIRGLEEFRSLLELGLRKSQAHTPVFTNSSPLQAEGGSSREHKGSGSGGKKSFLKKIFRRK